MTLSMPSIVRAEGAQVPAGLPDPDGPLSWLDSGGSLARFNERYLPEYGEAAGIEVIYNGLGWSEIGRVLPLGIRNGTAPDAFVLPLNMQGAVAVNEGWVQPIEAFIPDFEDLKAGFPDGSFVEGVNVFDGVTYALPWNGQRRYDTAVLFNQAVMNEVGYDHIGAARGPTYDEFRDIAAKITKTGTPGMIMGGKAVWRWGTIATHLAQRGGATVGTWGLWQGMNFATGEYDYANDAYVDAVELLLAMRDDGSIFPGVNSLTPPQARDFMTQGAAGMILQGPWNVPIWQDSAPDFNFGVAPLVAPDETAFGNPLYNPSLVQEGSMMYINRTAKNPEYVGAYLRFLGSLEGQTAYAKIGTCADPALFPQAFDGVELTQNERSMIDMAEALNRIHPNPTVRNADIAKLATAFVEPTLTAAQAIQGLFTGQLSGVRETLQGAADARNKAMDDAIGSAKADGANVDRSDLVFANWSSNEDYGPAQYAEL
jgi:multiple sugar transport system substrate-binding protein